MILSRGLHVAVLRPLGLNGGTFAGKMLRLAPWFWASLALVCLLAGTQYAHAHTVDLPPGQEHCFFEDMHSGDEMTLTYQVSGGGHLDIDVRLTDPENQLLYQHIRKDTGTYDFIAEKDGRYTYCFSNTFSTVADKSVKCVRRALQVRID